MQNKADPQTTNNRECAKKGASQAVANNSIMQSERRKATKVNKPNEVAVEGRIEQRSEAE